MKTIPSVKTISFNLLTFFVMLALFILPVSAEESDEVPDNGIPVVYINIDESQGTIRQMYDSVDHSVYCYGTIRITVPEGFHYSDFEETVLKSVDGLAMSMRGRGNSTWSAYTEKKPFKIKLDKKADIMGLGENKHWVLLANHFDQTLIRNRITAWLGDQMGFEFTPRGVPVDLVLSGEIYGTKYLGSYYLSENVRVDKNRLDIDELTETDTDPAIITGGYLLRTAIRSIRTLLTVSSPPARLTGLLIPLPLTLPITCYWEQVRMRKPKKPSLTVSWETVMSITISRNTSRITSRCLKMSCMNRERNTVT